MPHFFELCQIRPGRLFLLLAGLVVLSGCADVRRKAIETHLRLNPPRNLEVVGIDPAFAIEGGEPGVARVRVRYRTVADLYAVTKGAETPEGRESLARIEKVKEWAGIELTRDDPVRVEMEGIRSAVSRDLLLKRIQTPAGTEIETVVAVEIAKSNQEWTITERENPARAEGILYVPGRNAMEGSAEAEAFFEELAKAAEKLEALKTGVLEARDRLSGESLAALRRRLERGNSFVGMAFDSSGGARTKIRLLVTGGLNGSGSAEAVLSDFEMPQSAVRLAGSLERERSGRYRWAAKDAEAISTPPNGRGVHRIFSAKDGFRFEADGEGLRGVSVSNPGIVLRLETGPKADMIAAPEE